MPEGSKRIRKHANGRRPELELILLSLALRTASLECDHGDRTRSRSGQVVSKPYDRSFQLSVDQEAAFETQLKLHCGI